MSRRTLPVTAVALLATATALAGCGAGQSSQTYQPRTAADSTNASVGSLALRNLAITAPSTGVALLAGGDAVLTGTFVNEADKADKLLSATTDVAPTVELRQAGAVVADIAVPALGLSSGDASLILHGLTRTLRPGDYVTVTLAFAENGRKAVSVPVRNDFSRPRDNPTPGPSATP